jgi:precorrin-3B synthase
MASRDGPRLHVMIAGDAAHAAYLGTVAPADAIDTVLRLLAAIAARGPQARGRDLVDHQGDGARAPRSSADPIGRHSLRDGAMALGVGFAFGHTDAATLTRLVQAAAEAGATGLRTAPGRTLLVIAVAAERASVLADAAKDLGFVVSPDDPRRRVVACAGAPVCASAEIAARALAPAIAASAAPHLSPGEVIHASGCTKGCAHRGRAALTAIGRAGACDLVVDGVPAGSAAAAALPQRLAELAATRERRRG